MKDRFKFRYWDRRIKKIRFGDIQLSCIGQPFILEATSEGLRAVDIDDIEIMQCTGLKDKNGKLIFEGDILKVTGSRDASGYGVVEYLQAGCQFFVNGYLDYSSPYHPRRKGEFHQPLQEWLCTEVIGNIYENPEMLEVDNV